MVIFLAIFMRAGLAGWHAGVDIRVVLFFSEYVLIFLFTIDALLNAVSISEACQTRCKWLNSGKVILFCLSLNLFHAQLLVTSTLALDVDLA